VVSNFVSFHCAKRAFSFAEREVKSCSNAVFSAVLGSYNSSDTLFMLLRLTVSVRERRVIAKVAFSKGSSQHGKALLAEVGYNTANETNDLRHRNSGYAKNRTSNWVKA
jgi:hypothetical protein